MEHEAGRELDALIAAFLGDRLIRRGKWRGYWDCGSGRHYADEDGGPFHYSTDIAAAWLVVEAVERRGWWLELWIGNGLYGPRAGCIVGAYGDDETNFDSMADTTPLAICRAALKVMEENQ